MKCLAILKMVGLNHFHWHDQIRLTSESLDFSKKVVVLGSLLHLLISKPNWEVIACANNLTSNWLLILALVGCHQSYFTQCTIHHVCLLFLLLSWSRFHFFQCLICVFSLTRNSFYPTLFQQLGSWSSFISHNFVFLEH